jgi:pSer/pThr/pTyr-binding forkhead associated (FHA) protein
MDVHFVIVAPANRKRSVAVRLPILVGRTEEAEFRIQQDSVSRRHCEFFLRDEAVFVRDLGSTNGTMLDDEQISATVPTRVPPGSVVRIGGVAFRVDYAAAPAALAEHDCEDTVPMDATAEPPSEEPVVATEAGTALVDIDAGAPPAEGSFDWLPPTGEAPADEPDDENLNDFFKSLS